MLDEETEIEVATMRYVSAKTTIPIPKVHTYALSPTGLNGMPYIIMDYVNGHNLKDLNFGPGEIFGALQCAGAPQTPVGKHLYRQLADVYVQLRQLESPRVGALGPPSHGASVLTCDPEEISVCHRPLSMDMAMQEVDSLEPGLIFPPKSTLSTAKDYVNGLLMLADNNLEKETEQGIDERKPESILYAAHHFRRFVENEWLDPSANQGPFDLSMCPPVFARLVYWNLIFRIVVHRIPDATEEQLDEQYQNEVVPRIDAFMAASQERRDFLEMKIQEQLDYFDDEQEHYGYDEPRRIIERDWWS